MRFLIIVKATKDSEAGVMPENEAIAEMSAPLVVDLTEVVFMDSTLGRRGATRDAMTGPPRPRTRRPRRGRVSAGILEA